jgi:two-component system sensor histidine kinase KdpD
MVWSALLVLTTTVLVWARSDIEQSHAALTLLLIVLGGSVAGGRVLGFTLACLGFALIDYYFQPPYDLITINKPLDGVVLLAFLVTAGAATHLLARARQEADSARRRAHEVENVARAGDATLRYSQPDDALAALAAMVCDTLRARSCVIKPHEPYTGLVAGQAAGDAAGLAEDAWLIDARLTERAISEGVPVAMSETGDIVLLGLARFTDPHAPGLTAQQLALPLRADAQTLGVLIVRGNPLLSLGGAELRFLGALGHYAAISIERKRFMRDAAHAEALRETGRAKDQVLASVSHDLRTPLTTIKALAQELESRGEPLAGAIVEHADRLARIVGDLLELSRLRAGGSAVTLEFNTAEDVVGAALRRAHGILEGRTIVADIDIESSSLVGMFDFVRTLRILGNLLDNALRYTGPDGVVELRVVREGADLVFTVADRGEGVAPDERDRIFEAFYRPSTATPDAGHAGIGLSIARSLAELQGGSLTYAPRDGGGSEFILRLPGAELAPYARVQSGAGGTRS